MSLRGLPISDRQFYRRAKTTKQAILELVEHSARGLMGVTLLGEPCTIIVEEYESFGESAFRLRLQRNCERQT